MSDTPITDRNIRDFGYREYGETWVVQDAVPIETARQLEIICEELSSVLGEPLITIEWLARRAKVLDKWQKMKERK